jgi:hypothetical protein
MGRIVDKNSFLDDLKSRGIGYLTCKREGFNIYLAKPSENQILEMTDYRDNQLVLCSIIG